MNLGYGWGWFPEEELRLDLLYLALSMAFRCFESTETLIRLPLTPSFLGKPPTVL